MNVVKVVDIEVMFINSVSNTQNKNIAKFQ